MNIEVEGPDGVVIEFPEGTSPDVIKGVMRKRYGGQKETPVREGDWQAVAGRVRDTEQRFIGPLRDEDKRFVRQSEAAKQGALYGAANAGALDTFGRRATNTIAAGLPQFLEAATSGFGTDLSTGEVHEFIKAADNAAGDKNPVSDYAGIATGILGQAAISPASAAKTTLGRVAGNAGINAGIGAAEGAVTSRGDVGDIAKGAAFGGIGGAIGSGLAEGAGRVIEKGIKGRLLRNAAPDAGDLRTFAKEGYETALNAPVRVAGATIRETADRIENQLVKEGFREANQPAAFRVLQEMRKAPETGISLGDIESIRKSAKAVFAKSDESAAARQVVNGVDDLLERISASDLVDGGADGIRALKQARSDYGAMKRSESIQDAIEQASIRAGSTYSGGNFNNALRQELRKVLNNKKMSSGFSDEEKKALKSIVLGSPVQNAARYLGKLAPSGGLSALLHIGAAGASGGASIPLAIAAEGSRRLAERSTRVSTEELSALLRMRSTPEARARLAEIMARPDVYQIPQGMQMLIARVLARGQESTASRNDKPQGPGSARR